MQPATRKLLAGFEACDKVTAHGDAEFMDLPAVKQWPGLKMTMVTKVKADYPLTQRPLGSNSQFSPPPLRTEHHRWRAGPVKNHTLKHIDGPGGSTARRHKAAGSY